MQSYTTVAKLRKRFLETFDNPTTQMKAIHQGQADGFRVIRTRYTDSPIENSILSQLLELQVLSSVLRCQNK